MTLPRASIIIPTYNRPDRLTACLDALANLDYPENRFEVLVVDDGSQALSSVENCVRAVGSRMSTHLLQQQHAGPAAARNLGANASRSELLAFTDDDCRPDAGWLRALVGALAKSRGAVVGGRTINALVDNTYSAASQALVSYMYDDSFRKGQPFVASNNFALSKGTFEEIGGFDERFPLAGGEDRDFCDRCLAAGAPIEYVPEATIRHYHHLTMRKFFRQHYSYGRGACAYRRAVALRRDDRIRFDPFRFYRDLVRFPFISDEGPQRFRMAGLLLLAQFVNAAGFFVEKYRGSEFRT